MSQVAIIIIKGLVGGAMVVLFAAIGEALRPRGLAGLTSAAPSVAVASLLVALVTSGVSAAYDLSLGMIAGAAAMGVWCLVGIEAIKRLGALRGSMITSGVWFLTAVPLWAVFLR